MSLRSRTTLVVAALVAAAAAVVLSAAPAQAVTYRYWTFWWGQNTGTTHTGWRFASAGPEGTGVVDTSVIGWRFATTAAAGTTTPRYATTYDAVCPNGSTSGSGATRVAIVVDYGSSSDWPPGETPPLTSKVLAACVSVPAGSTAAAAMAVAGLDIRTNTSGLICAISSFPATECAPIVSGPKPTPTPAPTHTTAPAPTPSHSQATTGASAATTTTAATASTSTSSSTAPSTSATAGPGGSASPSVSSAAVTSTDLPTTTPTESALPATTEVPVAATSPSGATTAPWGAVGGVAVVAILGSSAWWTTRRRRSA